LTFYLKKTSFAPTYLWQVSDDIADNPVNILTICVTLKKKMPTGKELVEIVKATPRIIEPVYDDLARPGVKKVGKALSTVLDLSNTILLPIKLINEKSRLLFKRHMDYYEKKISNINEDKIINVPSEIGIPILDKLTYTSNDKIADLFINLLHKASSIDTINIAHPSFVDFISRLSLDEASIIKYLKGKSDLPCVSLLGYPKKNVGYNIILKNITDLNDKIKLDFPNNIIVYLDNLISMGLLTRDENRSNATKDFYKTVLDKVEIKKNELKKENKFKKFEITNGIYSVTDFGKLFIEACNG